jgi:hypothetical protein
VDEKLCRALTVPVAGPLMLTVNGVEEIVIRRKVDAVLAL